MNTESPEAATLGYPPLGTNLIGLLKNGGINEHLHRTRVSLVQLSTLQISFVLDSSDDISFRWELSNKQFF